MIQINASFNPFRMKISRKEPVTLSIALSNKSNEPKILSMTVKLGRELSLEKGGYRTEQLEKIPTLKPSEKKIFYYEVFPKAGTRAGEHLVSITVAEHYKNFNYVAREYKKSMALIVED